VLLLFISWFPVVSLFAPLNWFLVIVPWPMSRSLTRPSIFMNLQKFSSYSTARWWSGKLQRAFIKSTEGDWMKSFYYKYHLLYKARALLWITSYRNLNHFLEGNDMCFSKFRYSDFFNYRTYEGIGWMVPVCRVVWILCTCAWLSKSPSVYSLRNNIAIQIRILFLQCIASKCFHNSRTET
jgi:hypothetical protein